MGVVLVKTLKFVIELDIEIGQDEEHVNNPVASMNYFSSKNEYTDQFLILRL